MAEKIELILFDMDNVLCTYDRHARAARLAEISGNTAENIYQAIWDSGFEQLGDDGTLSRREYLGAFGDRIGHSLSLAEWLDARRTSMKPNHAMLGVVDHLRRSVDVAVLTNNTELVVDHIDLLCPELRPLFGSRLYASARFRAAKPDVACYRRCLAELGVRSEAVLFIDDLAENIAGANAAGLHSHHFTTVEGFQAELKRYGILSSGAD
ncbi:HAD family phosphatase [Bradyrhizobium sp. CCGUVB1N3]|uniref:HAD family hydrolase n=1 Tax=Bradyrhizobium sp. CCGUVB1N3 TaxID=2949629 RepID=UPI0020B420C9|nr:HAD family phosphatase [Bradyrhizobium sp. CCGUVB1N3]MCP3469512.1 HAD family phosphatase [Bradyrhizobium sp. CCGUVB1N3]